MKERRVGEEGEEGRDGGSWLPKARVGGCS